jgi:hypothetical protein
MIFSTLVFLIAIVGGHIAAISGFGIKSLLTSPFVSHQSMKLAVARVSSLR